jgi:hypothetical protein
MVFTMEDLDKRMGFSWDYGLDRKLRDFLDG